MSKRKPRPADPDSLAASFRKLRQLLNRREKIGFLILLAGMIGAAAFEALAVGAVPVFVSLAMEPDKLLRYAWAENALASFDAATPQGVVVAGCIALLLIFVSKTAYNCALIYFKVRYTQNRQLKLTDRLFRAYMSAPYEFHLGRNTSELLRNTQREVMAIITGVITPFLNLIMQSMMALGIVALLLAREPGMALVSVGFMGLAGFAYQWRVRRKIRAYGREAQQHRSVNMQIVQQGLGSLKEVRILRRERFFIDALRGSLERMMIADRYSKVVGGITAPYMELVAIAGLLGVTMLLMAMGRETQTIAPTLALFAVAFVRLRTSITQVVSSVTAMRYQTVSIDPVHDDLKLLDRTAHQLRQRAVGSVERVPLTKEIALRNVRFRYVGAAVHALKDISLTIPRGQAVAFIGPTGAGKTTIVDIILGLLVPERGTVTVDGLDIHANLAAWQQNIGYIPQFIYLTDDTIRNNIALGLKADEIDDARIEQAVEAAHLTELVDRLPNRLDTIVGERGIRLSGGQRQRIGIARALYHNPDVLVMDEATSALDNATERNVIESVNELKGTRTIIMIAHRLSTVRECDILYRMGEGRVENAGPYSQVAGQQSSPQPTVA